MVKKWCWFSQVNSSMCYGFCGTYQFWCRSNARKWKILLLGWEKNIPFSLLSPNRVLIGFSQIVIPTLVLPKDGHTHSFPQRRLGLPWCNKILHVCAWVCASKCLINSVDDCKARRDDALTVGTRQDFVHQSSTRQWTTNTKLHAKTMEVSSHELIDELSKNINHRRNTELTLLHTQHCRTGSVISFRLK